MQECQNSALLIHAACVFCVCGVHACVLFHAPRTENTQAIEYKTIYTSFCFQNLVDGGFKSSPTQSNFLVLTNFFCFCFGGQQHPTNSDHGLNWFPIRPHFFDLLDYVIRRSENLRLPKKNWDPAVMVCWNIVTLVAFDCNFTARCVRAKFGFFSTLQTNTTAGSEKDQYLISERGLQVPSIVGCHEVQNQNKM